MPPHVDAALSDGDRPARYAAGRDGNAFAELVRRHGLLCGEDKHYLGPPRTQYSYDLAGDTLRLACYGEGDGPGAPPGFAADPAPAAPRWYVLTYKRDKSP